MYKGKLGAMWPLRGCFCYSSSQWFSSWAIHLYQSFFIVGKLNMFPVLKERRASLHQKVKKVQKIPIYCICCMPESDFQMVACSKCGCWYHTTCVVVPLTLKLRTGFALIVAFRNIIKHYNSTYVHII